MISVENFYQIVYQNLLEPIDVMICFSARNGLFENMYDYASRGYEKLHDLPIYRLVQCYDQEPIYYDSMTGFWDETTFLRVKPSTYDTHFMLRSHHLNSGGYAKGDKSFNVDFEVLANSEISAEKNKVLAMDSTHDWYYFYHGFAALDWFKTIPHHAPIKRYSKLFICFNHLFSNKRNYRLNLIANLRYQNLESHGLISLSQDSTTDRIKKEFDSDLLSKSTKKLVYNQLIQKPTDNLIIDAKTTHGALSACDDLNVFTQALFHIVTETIFYDDKLHLTEKIFKPIVARRPFLLVGAPGNLQYLKSYGFKTFDRWIDESYDNEPDPDIRIQMIITQLLKLAKMPEWQLAEMYQEMQQVLDYNYNWFYTDFKKVIVTELVDNFKKCLIKHNRGMDQSMPSYINYQHMDWSDIKRRLSI